MLLLYLVNTLCCCCIWLIPCVAAVSGLVYLLVRILFVVLFLFQFQRGGSLVQNPGTNTFCVLVNKLIVRANNIIRYIHVHCMYNV